MKKVIIALAGIVLFAASCDKDDDKINDCQAKNYGTLKVNFSAANVRHSILVTANGSSIPREKIIEIGKVSDTLHLYSGPYTVSLSSINDKSEAIESENKSSVIKTCTTTELNSTF